MNCLLGHTFTKQERKTKPERKLHLSNSGFNKIIHIDTADINPLHCASLACEILESAHFFFQHKGFEKTTIQDICNRLNITSAHFYNHFESLDEVLEILWAR